MQEEERGARLAGDCPESLVNVNRTNKHIPGPRATGGTGVDIKGYRPDTEGSKTRRLEVRWVAKKRSPSLVITSCAFRPLEILNKRGKCCSGEMNKIWGSKRRPFPLLCQRHSLYSLSKKNMYILGSLNLECSQGMT